MNNRRSGHNAERKWVALFATHFSLEAFAPTKKNAATAAIGTTRQFSPALDAMKIDIWISRKIDALSNLCMQIKKKVVKGKALLIDVTSLTEMITPQDDDFKVLVTNLKQKSKTRETEIGWFVTMPAEDWLRIVEEWQKLKTHGK